MDAVEETDYISAPLFRRKETYLRQKDIYVEVIAKRRSGKCIGASPLEQMANTKTPKQNLCQTFNYISNDIWYHISKHIPPKDVQNFALICRQTADIVKTKRFWMNLYKCYCQSNSEWNLLLPERLQLLNIQKSDKSSLRWHVIEALFCAYKPFAELLSTYSLDSLIGQTYKASWQKQWHCFWLMIYKFSNNISSGKELAPKMFSTAVEDWESLAESSDHENTILNPQEGITLLVILCDNFVPFLCNLLYKEVGKQFRLQATRVLLNRNMRSSRLELDFVDNNQTTTTHSHEHQRYKVVPWWHPEFRSYMN